MDIITKNRNKTNFNTSLNIYFNDEISEFLGEVIPWPNDYKNENGLFVYSWVIVGFFATFKGINYLNDIIARISLTTQKVVKSNTNNTNKPTTTELKHFQNLKSISQKIINTNRFDTQDTVFWVLKLQAEELIINHKVLNYSDLLEFGLLHFLNPKMDKKRDFSTIKAKVRSIYRYYEKNGYKLGKYVRKYNDEELKMSRSLNMTKVRNNIKKQNIKKLKHFLSGMFVEEYKKPNGSLNITKISKEINLSRQTIYNLLPEIYPPTP